MKKIDLSSFIPMLGVEGAQGHINMLWRYNQGTLLYLSSGAGRGFELTRVHPFEQFQEHFIQLPSLSNEIWEECSPQS